MCEGGGLVARVDKTQFEKPVVGNDCFWPPSCRTARALYCAVCWGGCNFTALSAAGFTGCAVNSLYS